jgi:hypothetical protein
VYTVWKRNLHNRTRAFEHSLSSESKGIVWSFGQRHCQIILPPINKNLCKAIVQRQQTVILIKKLLRIFHKPLEPRLVYNLYICKTNLNAQFLSLKNTSFTVLNFHFKIVQWLQWLPFKIRQALWLWVACVSFLLHCCSEEQKESEVWRELTKSWRTSACNSLI